MQDRKRHPRRRRDDTPTDPLLLAAVARAQRHRAPDGGEAAIWDILDHLTIGARTSLARRVRSRLEILRDEGLLSCSRRHGIVVWGLTPAGRRRLRGVLASEDPPVLPESPQHRAWCTARALAESEIGRFHSELGNRLREAQAMLASDPAADSDTWFELAERLKGATWRVGSATYCLREWPEPSDDRADIDSREAPSDGGLAPQEREQRVVRRAGRRNVRLWTE